MQKLTRREWVKLAATAGLAALLGALASGIDPEEKVKQLEQPTEEPETENSNPLATFYPSPIYYYPKWDTFLYSVVGLPKRASPVYLLRTDGMWERVS
jgi:hypothetical protein